MCALTRNPRCARVRWADKETFEPIVEPLLALTHPDGAPVVREAWAFDMQSHGEAAGWNASVLGDEGLCECFVFLLPLLYARCRCCGGGGRGERLCCVYVVCAASRFMKGMGEEVGMPRVRRLV